MYLGGLKPLQTASLIVAVPLIFVIALCVWSFLRWLKEDGWATLRETRRHPD